MALGIQVATKIKLAGYDVVFARVDLDSNIRLKIRDKFIKTFLEMICSLADWAVANISTLIYS
jgi:hypothetical protein